MKVFSHTRRIAFLSAFVVAVASASPALAVSGSCQAPPGTSAVDQYCEALPSPGGSGGNKHKRSHHVNNTTSKELEQQGSAGQAVLNLANSSGSATTQATPAPAPVKHAKKKVHKQKKKHHAAAQSSKPAEPASTAAKPAAAAAPAPSGNPVSAVGSAIGTGSGAGTAFITLLVAIAVLMGATAFVGRRRRAGEN